MLLLDIDYNKTCSLEDGAKWRDHNQRFEAISEFCKLNETAKHAFCLFTQENRKGVMMIYKESLQGHPITEGFIEAVISNV